MTEISGVFITKNDRMLDKNAYGCYNNEMNLSDTIYSCIKMHPRKD